LGRGLVLRLRGRGRRSQVEIIYVILKVCLDGTASKTKIVYDANLNFTRLKKYLNLLLNMGYLIEENNPSKKVVYRTTKAGRLFIRRFSWKQRATRNKR
jgi:predicted transcriptional regulator